MRVTHLRSLLLAGAALVCFSAALMIVWQVGLPEPSRFTGFIVNGTQVAPEIGSPAPPFSAPALTGEPLRLSELRGNIVVLNFWATWCVPCEIEMPELQALHENWQAHNVQVIGINIGEERAAIDAWLSSRQITFPLLLDASQSISQQYQLRGQPMTFVIDRQGIIRAIFYGATTRDALERMLTPLL
jgi:peroxiredoxin